MAEGEDVHKRILVRRAAFVAVVGMAGAPLLGAQAASASPVPASAFTCGVTVFTPCNQTAHFSDFNQQGTPLSNASASCPAFVRTDFVSLIGTGNGVEHSIVNNAGDAWFTSTFTGTATITAYTDPGLTKPDPNVAPFTGKITQWVGGSFNKQNVVFHDTLHFSGTAANGTALTIHDVSHTNTTPTATVPHSFEITSC
jgi:hypothetical protein